MPNTQNGEKPPRGLSSALHRAIVAWESGDSETLQQVMAAAKVTAPTIDQLSVVIVPTADISGIDQAALQSLGCTITGRSRSLMQVSIPIGRLSELGDVSGVRFVREPIRPHSSRTTSQGVSLTQASSLHAAGITGTGIRVAIIDIGFEGIRATARQGDLPNKWRWRDFSGNGFDADGSHGTSVAEIVHDMAPDAELFYYNVNSSLDFENAVDAAIAAEVDVVNCSLQWFGTGFGDGTGLTCEAVDRAAAAGIFWANSAGNQAQKVYNEFFQDSDDDGFHNIDGELEVLRLIDVAVGDTVDVWLTWNDWPLTTQDYDLALSITDDSGNVSFAAQSEDVQFFTNPVEHIRHVVTEEGNYGLVIWKARDARATVMKVESVNHRVRDFPKISGTLGVPADARGAVAIGAVPQGDWNAFLFFFGLEEFSSRGPTFDGRIKPELVAPDGVSSFSHGGPFGGTSAASPHVAGAAALIKSTDPLGLSADDIKQMLFDNAEDKGDQGKDNEFGWGKLDLGGLNLRPALPTLSVSSREVSFGTVPEGRTVSRNVSLENSGRGFLQLGSVSASSDYFVVTTSSPRQTYSETFDSDPAWLKTDASRATYPNSKLQLSSTSDDQLAIIGPDVSFQGDIDIAVDTEWISGVDGFEYGLIFNSTDSGQYRFVISANGYYSIYKWDGMDLSTLVEWTESAAIVKHGKNRIRVRRETSLTKCFVNGQLVEEFVDEDFNSGFAALEVFRSQNVLFDNFRVLTGEFFFPPSVPPQESQNITVTFFPFQGAESSGQLTIFTDDPTTPIRSVDLSANISNQTTNPPGQTAKSSDFNDDGAVDFSDFLTFAAGFGTSRGETGYDERLDLDGDGSVGFSDFLEFAADFGR